MSLGISILGSRQATKEHHFKVKVRPQFTHQQAARELHGVGVGVGATLRFPKALLRAVKTLISCKAMKYSCFVILLGKAEHSSEVFQFAEQAGERQAAREARGIEVFQEPDTSQNMTMLMGELAIMSLLFSEA